MSTGSSGSSWAAGVGSSGAATLTDASDIEVSEDADLGRTAAGCDTIEHSDMSEFEGKLVTLAVEGT